MRRHWFLLIPRRFACTGFMFSFGIGLEGALGKGKRIANPIIDGHSIFRLSTSVFSKLLSSLFSFCRCSTFNAGA